MKFEISKEKLKNTIQNLLYSQFNTIKKESEDWGLGEMTELHEIDSISKIYIYDILILSESINVLIVIHSTAKYYEEMDYQNIRAELQYRIEEWFPTIKIFIEDIIYEK